MVGERLGFGNLFKPPFPSSLTVLMVDDLSDLIKNKFTVVERVEIVKKLGKNRRTPGWGRKRLHENYS